MASYFSIYDKDGFLRFDAQKKTSLNKDELYLQLYRETWKVLLKNKIPQEAFNDFVEVLKNNYVRNDILASISFSKYDSGTLELFQQYNKSNLETTGKIVHNNLKKGEKCEDLLNSVDRTIRELFILFNRNPFLTLIKFYILILYENVDQKLPPEDLAKELFEFSQKMNTIFNFMIFCLKRSSEIIFDDYNMLDEVISGEDSEVYH